MKTTRILLTLLALALAPCALPRTALAQLVTNNDERITPPAPADRVCVAAQKPGGDVGARVNACDASLGAAKGEIWLTGGGNISTRIVISPHHTLRVLSGTYTATTPGTVIWLKDNTTMRCDSWAPVFEESTAANVGGIGIGADGTPVFTIVKDFAGGNNNGALAQNIQVVGCHFRGARSDFSSAPQTVSLGNCRNCSATGNWLEGTRTIGIQAGGAAANGNYAQNVTISDNLLTGVASQNIAVTNVETALIQNNMAVAPGQIGGPGVTVIDVEPNAGDRTRNVKIHGNHIDLTNTPVDANGAKVNNAIAVQNGVGASPYGHIEVTANTIIAGDHADNLGNRASYGILVRTAQDVRVADNFLRRATRGIVVDFGSTAVTVERNTCVTCGTPSSFPMSVDDSSNNKILHNVLYNQPGDALGYPDSLVRNIVETGSSNNNIYAGNYGAASLAGAGSRVIYEHNGTTSFDFRPPAGAAPFTVTAGAAKVSNLDSDKLDGQDGPFYQNASNLNAGVAAPARLGTGTPDSTKFLRGDGTWATVSNGTPSGWTDDGAVVRLTTATDSVGVGTSNPVAKFDVKSGTQNYTNLLGLDTLGGAGTLFGVGLSVNNESYLSMSVFRGGVYSTRLHVNTAGNVGLQGDGGNVGVGTWAPTAKLQVVNGDVYVGTVGRGVILRSPNGSCFRLTVTDAGALTTAAVGCP